MKELGTPAFIVHRAEYLQILASQLEGTGIVHLNANCTGFEQDKGGVTAHFVDGRKERGTVLIGADGIHSVVRKVLLGDEPLRYSGYTACSTAFASRKKKPKDEDNTDEKN